MYDNGIMREQMLEGFDSQKKKLHGKCHERDCLAKQEILKPLVHEDLPVKLLFERSEYKGTYKSFTSHLSKYVKYGYVEKLTPRPAIYHLTEHGKLCCIDDPFGYRKERIALHNELMKKYDENQRIKYTEVVHATGGLSGVAGAVTSEGGGVDSSDHKTDTEIEQLKLQLKDKDDELEKSELAIYDLERKLKSARIDKQIAVSKAKDDALKGYIAGNKKPDTKKKPRTINYWKMIGDYQGRMIDKNYFEGVDGVPYRLIKYMVDKGSISKIKSKLTGKVSNAQKGKVVKVHKNDAKLLVSHGFAEELGENYFKMFDIISFYDYNVDILYWVSNVNGKRYEVVKNILTKLKKKSTESNNGSNNDMKIIFKPSKR